MCPVCVEKKGPCRKGRTCLSRVWERIEGQKGRVCWSADWINKDSVWKILESFISNFRRRGKRFRVLPTSGLQKEKRATEHYLGWGSKHRQTTASYTRPAVTNPCWYSHRPALQHSTLDSCLPTLTSNLLPRLGGLLGCWENQSTCINEGFWAERISLPALMWALVLCTTSI